MPLVCAAAFFPRCVLSAAGADAPPEAGLPSPGTQERAASLRPKLMGAAERLSPQLAVLFVLVTDVTECALEDSPFISGGPVLIRVILAPLEDFPPVAP